MQLLHPLTSTLDLGGIWRIGLAVLGIIGAVLFAKKTLAPRIGVAASALWAYVLAACVYVIEFPLEHYGAFTAGYQATAGGALIAALFIPWLGLTYPRKILALLPWYVAFEIVCLAFGETGLLGPESFTLAFLALTIPFLNVPLVLIIWGFILFKHGATAQMIVCAQLLGVALKMKDRRIVLGAGLIASAFIAAAAYHTRGVLFDSGVRLWKWKQMFHVWAANWKQIVFGTGPGSFAWESVAADGFTTGPHGIFLEMHNDWFQILFEYGLIGLALSLAVFITALKRSYVKPLFFQATLGAGAFMLTYYPLHYATTGLTVAMIIGCALRKDDVECLR